MLKNNDQQYISWISDLKQRIQQSQIKAAIQVNSALIEMYWDLGKEISERSFENTYGSGFFKKLSQDLRNEFPEIKGFFESNLKFFRRFYLFYNQEITNHQQLANEFKNDNNSNLQQVARDLKNGENQNSQQLANDFSQKLFLIPWFHHVTIITKCKNIKEALFYINKTIENGWSRAVLLNMISGNLYQSQGKAITNFSKTLPDYDSELVKQTLKDPYIFDFISISDSYKERELENALIDNIQKFLIELGNGFAFVGKQVEMKFGNQSFFIDLLFYHIKLKRYVVIELKTGEFKPEHAGKLNFYVTSVDKQLRDENDNATVGLIICKTKDDIIAEYSLTDLHKPWESLPTNLKKYYQTTLNLPYPASKKLKMNLIKISNEKTSIRFR